MKIKKELEELKLREKNKRDKKEREKREKEEERRRRAELEENERREKEEEERQQRRQQEKEELRRKLGTGKLGTVQQPKVKKPYKKLQIWKFGPKLQTHPKFSWLFWRLSYYKDMMFSD